MSESNKHGAEAAITASNQTQELPSLDADAFFQQSVIIGAIARTLSFVGLVADVQETRNGIHNFFDFEEPEERIPVKVFRFIDGAELEKYHAHPRKPLVIIDASDMAVELEECPECGQDILHLTDDKRNVAHRDEPNHYVYYDADLWRPAYCIDKESGTGGWERMIPALILSCLQDIEDEDAGS